MNIIINGIGGFMGREVKKAAEKGYNGAVLCGGIDLLGTDEAAVPCASSFSEAADIFSACRADCIIDFSNHACTEELCELAIKLGLPVVVATTGHTDDELAAIHNAAKKIPVFHSANMSLGVALLCKLAKEVAAAMPDAEIEIIEKHHDRKLDAPSGTAMMLYREIAKVRTDATPNLGRSGVAKRTPNEIGIHAIRMGNIVGEHEVIIGTNTQSITLKHEAYDRALFAEGAIVAAQFLCGQRAGLYDMHDLLGDR